jgi:predicted amidohydrolase YtcJ
MVVKHGHIVHVGSGEDEEVLQARKTGPIVDLGNRVVLPGFIDGHVHIMNFGMSLQKLDLLPCKSLPDIRQTIAVYAAAHKSDPRILCRGWIQSITEGKAFATELDDLDPRPVYIEALDLHSTWCNTAALKELQVQSMSRSMYCHYVLIVLLKSAT